MNYNLLFPKKTLLLGLLFNLFSHLSIAQSFITGKVTSQDGQPIIGASVNVKGNTTTAITSSEGAFSVAAGVKDILIISNVGYQTQEIAVKNFTDIRVVCR